MPIFDQKRLALWESFVDYISQFGPCTADASLGISVKESDGTTVLRITDRDLAAQNDQYQRECERYGRSPEMDGLLPQPLLDNFFETFGSQSSGVHTYSIKDLTLVPETRSEIHRA